MEMQIHHVVVIKKLRQSYKNKHSHWCFNNRSRTREYVIF